LFASALNVEISPERIILIDEWGVHDIDDGSDCLTVIAVGDNGSFTSGVGCP
jgi:hypothetical protein